MQQLIIGGEMVNITDITKHHFSINETDTRDGHNDRIMEFHDFSHF